MAARALAALAGSLAALLWPSPWPAAVVPCLLAGAGLAVWRWRLALAVGLAAAAWTQLAVQEQLHSVVHEDTRVLVEARVTSLPVLSSRLVEFDVRARLTRRPGQPVRALRVRWPGAPVDAPRVGETWQLALQLRASRVQTNPGAVDGLRVLWRDHLAGRADVVDSPLNRRLAVHPPPLERLRQRAVTRILAIVPDPAAAALLAALAVGYTGEVDRADWQVYNATGITHLIAISGMHVTLFAAVVMAALRRLWGWWPAFAWRVRRESFVALAGVACAALYTLLAGNSVPSQRTVLMLAAGLGWRALGRASSPASAVGAALVAVIALDPFAVLAAGFWLSFGAVAIILWRDGSRLRAPGAIAGAMRLQLAITAALVPATLANFATVSLAGLLVNPVAIPLFSFVLVPLVLAAAACIWLSLPSILVDPLLILAGVVATPTQALLARVAYLPLGVWSAMPPATWYVFSAIGCLLCVLPVPARVRLLALAALLPLLCAPRRPVEGEWRALRLDAGSAPVVLVVTHRHALLFGTGDVHATRGARVPALIVPAARSLGIAALDVLVAGRMDPDVAAGIGAIQSLLPAAVRYAAPDREGRLPPVVKDCDDAPAWQWDGVSFDLWRQEGVAGCALRIGTGEAAVELSAARIARDTARGAALIEGGRGPPRVAALGPRAGVWQRDAARP